MAEKGFGVKEINLIGPSGTPTITSPNNLNLNANNVAISTNVSIGGTLSVTGNVSVGGTLTYEDVTNIDSVGLITAREGIKIPDNKYAYFGSDNDLEITHTGSNGNINNKTGDLVIRTQGSGDDIFIDSVDDVNIRVQSTDNAITCIGDGAVTLHYNGNSKLATTNTGIDVTGAITVNGSALSITPTNSDIQVAYTVTANGSSAYRFAGNGVVSTADNPDIYLIRGQKYRFINNSGGSHPFQIRVSNGGSAYSTGVTNNGAASGNIDFAPTYDSPAQLVYQCTSHGGMVGNIYISGGQYGGMTLLASATLSSSGTVAANITFNTAGFQYLYGKLHSLTRPSGNIGDVGLRWNGSSSTVYDFVMQRMDNGGTGSTRHTQGANQFYYNMNGVAGWTSGRNQAVFELHLVNDGTRKPFNMKHSGELSGGPIVLTTDGMLDLTSSITSLEITTSDTDINGGTLELYGVR